MKIIVGWLAMILSAFALAPSIIPGAMSLIGLVASLFALLLSLISVAPNKTGCFKGTLVIVLVGLFLVNDTLRIFGALPDVPSQFKAVAYGMSGLVIVACVVASRRLSLIEIEKT